MQIVQYGADYLEMEAMKRNEEAEVIYLADLDKKVKAEEEKIKTLFQTTASYEEMHQLIAECEGAPMLDLHEQSGDGAAAEVHIDMADDDSSDGDYEQDPEGSDDCDSESADSDDVEAFQEGLDPNPSQVAPGVAYQRNVRTRPK